MRRFSKMELTNYSFFIGYKDCFTRTIDREGYRGLFKGVGMCFLYHMTHSMVFIKAFHMLESRFRGTDQQRGGAMSLLVFGCASGMV